MSPRFLMVEETGFGADYPFSGEKLAPVLTVYRAETFDAAADIVRGIYAYMGAGHSVGLHSTDSAQAVQLGLDAAGCARDRESGALPRDRRQLR